MTTWTETPKADNSQSEQHLLIEGAFKLLIGDGHMLKIQEERISSWTPTSKATTPTWTPVTKAT